MKHIVMLRGINVSGQKLIKMADLREHLSELPIKNVETYIQSGNIVLDSEITDPKKIETLVKEKIKEKYGWDVPTTSKSLSDFNYLIHAFPFIKDSERDPKKMCVIFLSDQPRLEHIQKLSEYNYDGEEYVIDSNYIFYYAANGFGKAKMSNNFFESKLKVTATSRNWRTVNILNQMAMNNQ